MPSHYSDKLCVHVVEPTAAFRLFDSSSLKSFTCTGFVMWSHCSHKLTLCPFVLQIVVLRLFDSSALKRFNCTEICHAVHCSYRPTLISCGDQQNIILFSPLS
eukprot:c19744_g1_i1 orf=65-373(+)